MKLHKDFAGFILLFHKYKADYLLVGGFAVSIHSQPGATVDIDFFRLNRRLLTEENLKEH